MVILPSGSWMNSTDTCNLLKAPNDIQVSHGNRDSDGFTAYEASLAFKDARNPRDLI
jgi:hypothetical protein